MIWRSTLPSYCTIHLSCYHLAIFTHGGKERTEALIIQIQGGEYSVLSPCKTQCDSNVLNTLLALHHPQSCCFILSLSNDFSRWLSRSSPLGTCKYLGLEMIYVLAIRYIEGDRVTILNHGKAILGRISFTSKINEHSHDFRPQAYFWSRKYESLGLDINRLGHSLHWSTHQPLRRTLVTIMSLRAALHVLEATDQLKHKANQFGVAVFLGSLTYLLFWLDRRWDVLKEANQARHWVMQVYRRIPAALQSPWLGAVRQDIRSGFLEGSKPNRRVSICREPYPGCGAQIQIEFRTTRARENCLLRRSGRPHHLWAEIPLWLFLRFDSQCTWAHTLSTLASF